MEWSYERQCAECGKLFRADKPWYTTKYCCRNCANAAQAKQEKENYEQNREARQANQRKYAAEKRAKSKPKKSKKSASLAAVNQAARDLGLSYGEYVARYGGKTC